MKEYKLIDIETFEQMYDCRISVKEKVEMILVRMCDILSKMLELPKIDLNDIYYLCNYKAMVDMIYKNNKHLATNNSPCTKLLFIQFYGMYELVNRKETY